MIDSILVSVEKEVTILTSKESEAMVIVSETQGPPGPSAESADAESTNMTSDAVAYYILAKN